MQSIVEWAMPTLRLLLSVFQLSDPSLFPAPFFLAKKNLISFEQSWKCVSQYLAEAAKIGDQKGKIASGYDADFLLLPPDCPLPSTIRAVYISRRPAKQSC